MLRDRSRLQEEIERWEKKEKDLEEILIINDIARGNGRTRGTSTSSAGVDSLDESSAATKWSACSGGKTTREMPSYT